MSDKGPFIEVEVGELVGELPAVLRELRENGRRVRLVENGRVVANLTPPRTRAARKARTLGAAGLPMHPELGPIIFNVDPTEPLSEEDWPECMR